jgi:hypothetical protein
MEELKIGLACILFANHPMKQFPVLLMLGQMDWSATESAFERLSILLHCTGTHCRMNEHLPVKGPLLPVTQAEASAWGGFLYAYAILTRRLDKELREEHNLSFASFEVLFLLACAPEQRMRLSDLAAAVLTNPTRISRLVESLREEGLWSASVLHTIVANTMPCSPKRD